VRFSQSFVVEGLLGAGKRAMADQIISSTLDLLTESGFAEYYHPQSGELCGDDRSYWTAAMVLKFLHIFREDRF
jgi:hypothetical protein